MGRIAVKACCLFTLGAIAWKSVVFACGVAFPTHPAQPLVFAIMALHAKTTLSGAVVVERANKAGCHFTLHALVWQIVVFAEGVAFPTRPGQPLVFAKVNWETGRASARGLTDLAHMSEVTVMASPADLAKPLEHSVVALEAYRA